MFILINTCVLFCDWQHIVSEIPVKIENGIPKLSIRRQRFILGIISVALILMSTWYYIIKEIDFNIDVFLWKWLLSSAYSV